jgi:hypothetical protein
VPGIGIGIGITVGKSYDCPTLSDLLDQAFPCKLTTGKPVAASNAYAVSAPFRLTCTRSTTTSLTIDVRPGSDFAQFSFTLAPPGA